TLKSSRINMRKVNIIQVIEQTRLDEENFNNVVVGKFYNVFSESTAWVDDEDGDEIEVDVLKLVEVGDRLERIYVFTMDKECEYNEIKIELEDDSPLFKGE